MLLCQRTHIRHSALLLAFDVIICFIYVAITCVFFFIAFLTLSILFYTQTLIHLASYIRVLHTCHFILTVTFAIILLLYCEWFAELIPWNALYFYFPQSIHCRFKKEETNWLKNKFIASLRSCRKKIAQ